MEVRAGAGQPAGMADARGEEPRHRPGAARRAPGAGRSRASVGVDAVAGDRRALRRARDRGRRSAPHLLLLRPRAEPGLAARHHPAVSVRFRHRRDRAGVSCLGGGDREAAGPRAGVARAARRALRCALGRRCPGPARYRARRAASPVQRGLPWRASQRGGARGALLRGAATRAQARRAACGGDAEELRAHRADVLSRSAARNTHRGRRAHTARRAGPLALGQGADRAGAWLSRARRGWRLAERVPLRSGDRGASLPGQERRGDGLARGRAPVRIALRDAALAGRRAEPRDRLRNGVRGAPRARRAGGHRTARQAGRASVLRGRLRRAPCAPRRAREGCRALPRGTAARAQCCRRAILRAQGRSVPLRARTALTPEPRANEAWRQSGAGDRPSKTFVSSSISTGLTRWYRKPASCTRRFSVSWPKPDSAITTVRSSDRSSRSRRKTPYPSSFGSARSRSTTSGRKVSARSTALSPSCTVATSWPRKPSSSASISAASTLSSTTRTRRATAVRRSGGGAASGNGSAARAGSLTVKQLPRPGPALNASTVPRSEE